MSQYPIVSMMLCESPRFVAERFWLSASSSVWEPIAAAPESWRNLITDEIGNSNPDSYESLQLKDRSLLNLIDRAGVFACFRSVNMHNVIQIDVVPDEKVYHEIAGELCFIGWDICTGNGWLTASCHGIFPINPFTGSEIDSNASMINLFGLFEGISDCVEYCRLNNLGIPEHSPWFPVGVSVTKRGIRTLVDSI